MEEREQAEPKGLELTWDTTELYAEDAMHFVEIETESFSGTVVSLKDMPGEKVIGVFATNGPAQMFKTLKLFKLAQMDPRKIDQISELTFGELGEALDQWMAKSMKSEMDSLDDNKQESD